MAPKIKGVYQNTEVPESMPKNMLTEPGIAAMQKSLAGAKMNKMMKVPKPRMRTASNIVKKAV